MKAINLQREYSEKLKQKEYAVTTTLNLILYFKRNYKPKGYTDIGGNINNILVFCR